MNTLIIKKACKIADAVFSYVMKTVAEQETEKSLAARIDKKLAEYGASPAFSTIVASGPHSAFIHHKPCLRKIRKNEPILIDFGAKINGFCSDLSRTIFINEIPRDFQKIYKIVLLSQEASIKKIKSNACASAIDEAARKIIASHGFGACFRHSLGHGLGKKVHESPSLSPKSKEKIKTGDVITIEPGIYIRGRGGVRIEDDIQVKLNSHKLLTKSPKKLREIIIK